MALYQLTPYASVTRTADGASIPNDPKNRDRADYEAWLAAGGVPDPYVAPAPPPPSFLARDFFALLTPEDYTAIQAAAAKSPALGLLWASLPAQGEAPVRSDAARFLAGWVGLKQALGAERAASIAGALGILDA